MLRKLSVLLLTLGDIPANLDKDHWIAFIDNHIQTSINKASLSVNNIDTLPHSRNIISSVIITPIAIILSLFAIILNITLLVSRHNKFIGGGVFIGVIIVGVLWSYNPYQINVLLNKIIGVETRFVQLLSPYKHIIHNTFVNDTNPNTFDIVRIEKPSIPDTKSSMDQIQKEFDKLSESNNQTAINQSNAEKELYVDDNKLNDKNYYGEINKKSNPKIIPIVTYVLGKTISSLRNNKGPHIKINKVKGERRTNILLFFLQEKIIHNNMNTNKHTMTGMMPK